MPHDIATLLMNLGRSHLDLLGVKDGSTYVEATIPDAVAELGCVHILSILPSKHAGPRISGSYERKDGGEWARGLQFQAGTVPLRMQGYVHSVYTQDGETRMFLHNPRSHWKLIRGTTSLPMGTWNNSVTAPQIDVEILAGARTTLQIVGTDAYWALIPDA